MGKAANPLPSQEYLRQRLTYDQHTGIFTWNLKPGTDKETKRWNTAFAGKVAGSLATNGYRVIQIDDRPYMASRVAWMYVYGTDPKAEIDHANLDSLDNRISNLREATCKENSRNRRAHRDKGLPKGVHETHRKTPYRAVIMVDGKTIGLGRYHSIERAAEAYQKAAQRHYGLFARF